MVMRLAVVGALLLASIGPAWADFKAGLKAYETGEYAAAYREWLPLARDGDPAAQRNIGQLYRLGRGVARDPAIAAEWYLRAAKLGLGRAQANLAMLYLQGDGVEQDYEAAGKWFKAAAAQGHVIAQFNLAIMYERGLGFEPNKAKARAWYNLAAKAGHRRALDNLSRLVAAEAVDELTYPERKTKTAPASDAPPATNRAPTTDQASATDRAPTTDQASAIVPSADDDGAQPAPLEDGVEDEASVDPRSSPAKTGKLFGFLSRLFTGDDNATDGDAVPTVAETPEPPARADPDPNDRVGADPTDGSTAAGRQTAEDPGASGGSLITSLTALFSNDPAKSTEAAELAEDSAAPATGVPDPVPDPVPGSALADPAPVAPPIAPSDTEIRAPVDENAVATMADDGVAEAPRKGFFSRILGIFGGGKREHPAPATTPATMAVVIAPTAREPDSHQAASPGPTSPEPAATDVAVRSLPTDRPTAASASAGMYAYRRGDFQIALANWLPLAQRGDPNAQYLVGGLFLTGAGVPPDLVRAHMWWSLSSAEGHPRANRDMGALRTRMNPDQLVESKRLASAWRAAR